MNASAFSPRTRPVVLITGASAGLGKELVRELVLKDKAGALVLTARRADRLEELAHELYGIAPALQILTIPADLADPDAPRILIDELTRRFGGLDVLVNNAGLGLPTFSQTPSPIRSLAS